MTEGFGDYIQSRENKQKKIQLFEASGCVGFPLNHWSINHHHHHKNHRWQRRFVKNRLLA